MIRYLDFAARTTVLLASLAAVLVLLLAVFPVVLPVELLDVRPGYTHAEAASAIAGYGDLRMRYVWVSATLDTALPVLLVTFLAGLIHRFRGGFEKPASLAVWLPLVAGVLDLAENAQIIVLLLQFPDIGEAQVAFASTCTLAKTACFVASFGIGLVLAGAHMLRRARSRHSP